MRFHLPKRQPIRHAESNPRSCDDRILWLQRTGASVDLPRENYIAAEEKTIKELQSDRQTIYHIAELRRSLIRDEAESTEGRAGGKIRGICAVLPTVSSFKDRGYPRTLCARCCTNSQSAEVEFYIPKWVEMLVKRTQNQGRSASECKVCYGRDERYPQCRPAKPRRRIAPT